MKKTIIGLFLLLTLGLLLSGCTQQQNSQYSAEEIKELKERAISVSYNDLFRNNEDYVGKVVLFKQAQIIQVLEDNSSFLDFRANITKEDYGFTDTVYLQGYSGKRLLEDDVVEVYGVVTGLVKYETIMNTQVIVPSIKVLSISLISENSSSQTEQPNLENSNIKYTDINRIQAKDNLEVNLVKLEEQIIDSKKKVRVYWEIKNNGTASVNFICPHHSTQIITSEGGLYQSETLPFEESDSWTIGGGGGLCGTLPSGVKGVGWVNIENVPKDANIIKVILDDEATFTFNLFGNQATENQPKQLFLGQELNLQNVLVKFEKLEYSTPYSTDPDKKQIKLTFKIKNTSGNDIKLVPSVDDFQADSGWFKFTDKLQTDAKQTDGRYYSTTILLDKNEEITLWATLESNYTIEKIRDANIFTGQLGIETTTKDQNKTTTLIEVMFMQQQIEGSAETGCEKALKSYDEIVKNPELSQAIKESFERLLQSTGCK